MRYHIYKFGTAIFFYAVLLLTTAEKVESSIKPKDFDEYVYYQGVQGRPGIDFPVFARIPRTTFSCREVSSGYYADLETDCQVFHICNDGSKISFLCPNGTIFQQSDLICEWWFKVNCTNSPNLYEESAEQLLEESWRRKQNRKPGYQNRVAGEERRKTSDAPRKNPHNNLNFNQKFEFSRKETFPGSPNEQFFANQNREQTNLRNRNENARSNNKQNKQTRGHQKYKRPINLKGQNELNYDDSSEESQIPAETASFYNNNNQNVIQSTSKATTNQKFIGDQKSKQSFNQKTSGNQEQYGNQKSSQPRQPYPNQKFQSNPNQNRAQEKSNPNGFQSRNRQNQSLNHQKQSTNPQNQANNHQNQANNHQNQSTNPQSQLSNRYNQNFYSNQPSRRKSLQSAGRNLNQNYNQDSTTNQYTEQNSNQYSSRTQEAPQQNPNAYNHEDVKKTEYSDRTPQHNGRNPNHQTSDQRVNSPNQQSDELNQNSSQQYPNHKETYTEVHEPKFLSTKAYTTGPQTIPPQTVSTNRIPLNDGKPFVVSTPKSSYNIKEFTTENFVYSPTIPPFTTTKKGIFTTIPRAYETNAPTSAHEEVTFSAPYSNVVTERHQIQKDEHKKSLEDTTQIQVVESIPAEVKLTPEEIKSTTEFDTSTREEPGTSTRKKPDTSTREELDTSTREEPKILFENDNTQYVRISGGTQNKKDERPEKILLSVSTGQNHVAVSTKAPIVHRRYSAAISQANPNNACIDEVVNSKGTTKIPKSTTVTTTTTSTASPRLPTTKNPDFEVVIGRKRTEPESKVIKIKKYPEVHQPRSFEMVTESSIYRVDLSNQAIEKVTDKQFTLKPTGFYVTKTFNGEAELSTRFGGANTYLPKVTTPRGDEDKGTPVETFTIGEDFDVVKKPKPFELPPKVSSEDILATTAEVTASLPNYEVSSARPFSLESTILPTQPTIFTSAPSRTPKIYEHVTNMLSTIKEIIRKDNDTDTRAGLVVPPSAGPQTLHSLAVYFANALDGVVTENDNESTTERDEKAIELLSIPTLNRYKDLFKEDEETTTLGVTEDTNDLEGQHTKNGVVTPRVRQLAQVFTKALSSYLDDPDMFRKYLQEARPTEPTIPKKAVGTTQRSIDNNNTEEDELLNYSDADIKPDLPRLSTTPSVSPTWGYILAPNNSNSYEHNSLSTDGENLQSADSQSFVSQFNNYIKEKHFGKTTTPLSTELPKDHWTTSKNATDLWREKLYTNPQAINEDLTTEHNQTSTESSVPATEISYELRSLPKLELNSTQVHGILIDFMNTTQNENNRLNRILSKLNTTQDEFLIRMKEIEQNPLTRRLILLLISECANNHTQNDQKEELVASSSSNLHETKKLSKVELFDSSRVAENNKHVSRNSAIPRFVDETLKDEDEDTRALELLNSLYTIAARYGK